MGGGGEVKKIWGLRSCAGVHNLESCKNIWSGKPDRMGLGHFSRMYKSWRENWVQKNL
jgi:hypothetical protein